MSGLYNMLFGQHANADQLLALLGLTPNDIPRYRSCYWDGEHIVIHTRTGGGNRDYYESEESCRDYYPEYFTESESPSGPWNEDLRAVPGYIRDQDDDFDSTYADFFYAPPAEALEALKSLPAEMPPSEQWQKLFEKLGVNKNG